MPASRTVIDAPLSKLQRLAELRARAATRNADPATVFARLGYEPTERQQVFHDAAEFDVLYGGAAGGGKTKALLMQGIAWCMAHPGIRIGAFRRTYPELKESLLAELAQVGFAAELGAQWKGSDYDLRFPNGSLLMFRYAESLQDATRRQGGQYQGLLFDERTLTSPDVIDFLYSRVRSGRTDVPVVGVRSGSNPGGPGHGAVKKMFIDATGYGQHIVTGTNGRSVRFIPSKITDNPHLDADYASRLDSLPEAMRKAFRDGSWDVFAGQYFTEWNRDRHIVGPTEIPATWQRVAGMDWGYAAPWCVLWGAIDEDDRVWIYDELYATQVGESEQARRILAAEEGHGVAPWARFADDAMWTRRGEVQSVADTYAQCGCHLAPARKGERLSGWQRVRSYLADGPACAQHRAMGWEKCPRLHVLEGGAPNLCRTLPTLPYDTAPAKVEDLDTKAEDHAADALRYLLINVGADTLAMFNQGAPVPDQTDLVHPLTPAPFGWQPEISWTDVI